jgi:uncharacterized membrane protein (DUF485 family)
VRTTEQETVHQLVQASPEFAELRARLRRFAFPLLASYAPDVMAIPVLGNINLGLVVGLLQFVSTFVITGVYVRYANRRLDPAAARIRDRMEAYQ